MRRCPNPGCPFRVRHGFAAEFDDPVERCRSCSGRLVEPEPEPPPAAAPAAWPVARRGLVSLSLIAGVLGLASVGMVATTAVDADFATLSLWPSSFAWIGSTALIQTSARRLGAAPGPAPALRRALVMEGSAVLLSLLALAGAAASITATGAVPLFATMAVGIPILLAVRFFNDRWGLGHGVALLLAALLIHELAGDPWLRSDPIAHTALVLAMVAGAAVWLASPTRASATGRRAGEPGDLGLGLTVPSAGVLPILALSLAGLAHADSLPDLFSTLAGRLGGDRLDGPAPGLSLPIELGVGLLLTAALAWLHTRPVRLVAVWRRAFPKAAPAALRREADALFRRTLLRSALLIGVVQLLGREHLPALTATILAAILLDLRHELRHRLAHPELIRLPAPTNLVEATSLAQALELERRPCLVQGTHHLALYPGLATWLPALLLVRPGDRERALELQATLGSPD